MKIAFFDAKPYDRVFFDAANTRFKFSFTYIDVRLTPETSFLAQEHDAVCIFVNDNVNATVIADLLRMKVRLIALRCTGYNQVDLKAAGSKIAVVRVPNYSPYSVAEHALGLMLCLNRKLHRSHLRTRENNFIIDGLLGFDMCGKTAGVIGCGKIGSKMIGILKGLGMRVLGYDMEYSLVEQAGCAYADLATLYRESDIITLHCPLTPGTMHMINHASLSQMKDGVMIINTGRGALVHAEALVDALKSKKVGAAGLDVYEQESTCFYEDYSSSFIQDDTLARLLSFSNVLVTAHQAFFTTEAMNQIANTTLQNIQDFSEGKKLINCPQ